jgi:hypothetical protein
MVIVAVAGCASHDATVAQMAAFGRPLLDLESCLGPPARVLADQAFAPNEAPATVSEWDFTRTKSESASGLGAALSVVTSTVTLPLTLAGMSAAQNETQTCRAVAVSRDGIVASLWLSGNTRGLDGPSSGCWPLMRGCFEAWKG